jgi:hypothetical protein
LVFPIYPRKVALCPRRHQFQPLPAYAFHSVAGLYCAGRKPNLLELWWVTIIDKKRMAFSVVLKATRKGEVFVQTFHRIDVAEARRRLNGARSKGRLVREQANASALLTGGTDHLKKKGA